MGCRGAQAKVDDLGPRTRRTRQSDGETEHFALLSMSIGVIHFSGDSDVLITNRVGTSEFADQTMRQQLRQLPDYPRRAPSLLYSRFAGS